MKYINSKIFVISFLTALMAGCTPKPLKVNLPQAETRLVVASQVIPDAAFIVAVSKSFSALDNTGQDTTGGGNGGGLGDYLVSGAEVTITYNGITEKLYGDSTVPGIYAGLFIPQIVNTEYTLRIFDPATGLRAEASATMLPRVFFDTVYAFQGTGHDSEHVYVHYSLTDPADQPNWYMIHIYDAGTGDTAAKAGFLQNQSQNNHTQVFTDAAFDGQQHSDSIPLFYWNTDSLVVSISNISEGYYNYLNARERGSGLAASLFNEPVNFPGNVQGGYGFFTTHVPDIRLVTTGNH